MQYLTGTQDELQHRLRSGVRNVSKLVGEQNLILNASRCGHSQFSTDSQMFLNVSYKCDSDETNKGGTYWQGQSSPWKVYTAHTLE